MILSVTCWPANVRLRLLLYDALVIVMCYTDILCDPYSSSFFFISLDIVRVYRIKSFASPPFPLHSFPWIQMRPAKAVVFNVSPLFLHVSSGYHQSGVGMVTMSRMEYPIYPRGHDYIQQPSSSPFSPPPIFFFARHYITWYIILVELLPCKRGFHSLDVTVSVALGNEKIG